MFNAETFLHETGNSKSYNGVSHLAVELNPQKQTFNLSFFNNKRDNEPKHKDMAWDEFLKFCETPKVRATKDGRLFSSATFKGTRLNENAISVSMLVLDYDHNADWQADLAVWERAGYTYLAYTSYSHLRVTAEHAKAEQRFRVVLPLTEPISAELYAQLWNWAYKVTSGKIDVNTSDVSRMFYLPAIASQDASYDSKTFDGKLLDWRELKLEENNEPNKSKRINSKSNFDFEIRLNVKPPANKLAVLLENDFDFAQVWHKQKDKFNNDASRYDFSLANYLVRADWNNQEIVDALIAFRHRHKLESKVTKSGNPVKYYADTIAKVRTEVEQSISEAKAEANEFHQINKPEINARNEDYPLIARKALNALMKANEPPYLFRFGNLLCRMELNDNGFPTLVELNQSRMAYELTRAAYWYKTTKTKDKDEQRSRSTPSNKFVQDFLAIPNIELPVLTRIVTAPVFAADGTLQTKIGYNEKSRTYYYENKKFALDEISERPTKEQVENARSLIIDNLLGDFPFVSDADKAHSIALMLLPFVRDLIDGSTPLYDIEATTIGSGKTLLAKLLAIPSTPSPLIMTEARDEEEWRKRLTSALRNSPSFVIIDNVRHRLESTALASLLTANEWEDRLMGETKMIRLSVRAAFVVTANNPSFSDEMMRRSIRIRLDPKCDKAWLREGFKIPDIEDWARRNRAKLVWAVLTLIQAWILEGKPIYTGKKLGSYERWSEVMGGILKTVGVCGFLENLNEFYEEADEQGEAWRSLVAEWWYRFGERDVTVSDLWIFSADVEMLDFGNGTEQSRKVKFGKMLSSARDRQVGDFRIKRGGIIRRATQWRLEFVGDGVPPITLKDEEELKVKPVINYSKDVDIRFDTHTN